jgi:HAD superfamily hydrolase (TIGR01549 family)
VPDTEVRRAGVPWPAAGAGLRAVLLDVDFTVLRPSALFSAEGYRATGARFGLSLDPGRWTTAERHAHAAVKARRAGRGNAHDDAVYEVIAEAIVTALGGGEPATVARCAAAIVDEWSRCENFSLYDDVKPCLERLRAAGLAVGLVSNTNRDLGEVLESFALAELVDGAVTSSEIGLFKPAPEIFAAALEAVGAAAAETVMIGDSYGDDVEGARGAGLAGAVLLDRDGRRAAGSRASGPVIGSLDELPELLGLP